MFGWACRWIGGGWAVGWLAGRLAGQAKSAIHPRDGGMVAKHVTRRAFLLRADANMHFTPHSYVP